MNQSEGRIPQIPFQFEEHYWGRVLMPPVSRLGEECGDFHRTNFPVQGHNRTNAVTARRRSIIAERRVSPRRRNYRRLRPPPRPETFNLPTVQSVRPREFPRLCAGRPFTDQFRPYLGRAIRDRLLISVLIKPIAETVHRDAIGFE